MTKAAAAQASAGQAPGRVVMFVRNDAARDVRVRREATSLAEAGYAVTIVALQPVRGSLPLRERSAGVEIVRVPAPTGWHPRWQDVRYRPWRARAWLPEAIAAEARSGGVRGWLTAGAGIIGALILAPYAVVRLLEYLGGGRRRPQVEERGDVWDWLARWCWSILGWARAAAAAAPRATVYHGHDLNALPAAVEAQRRHGGTVVYDSHELFLEAGSTARRPAWARRILAVFEGRWARRASAVVTVNASIAQALARRYRAGPAVLVRNCPPRWDPPSGGGVGPLRTAIGVGPEARIVLYHGGFLPDRGLDLLAQAVQRPELAAVHLVYLGFGPGQADLEALAAAPSAGGRIHVLPAVAPEVLLAWVHDADVAAMPNQPVTLNERYSTPNKLFESLAAGIPVVSSDTPERRAVVIDDRDGPLGAVCDPTDPSAIAAAIRSLLDLSPDARAALRARCLAAAHARYNWEQESSALVGLYTRLAPLPPASPAHVEAGAHIEPEGGGQGGA